MDSKLRERAQGVELEVKKGSHPAHYSLYHSISGQILAADLTYGDAIVWIRGYGMGLDVGRNEEEGGDLPPAGEW